MERFPQGHKRSARKDRAVAREEDLDGSSYGLWSFAQSVAEAGRLAGERLDVRAVGAHATGVGKPANAKRLPRRGRSANLRWVRQHGGFRPPQVTWRRSRCRCGPARPLLPRLE